MYAIFSPFAMSALKVGASHTGLNLGSKAYSQMTHRLAVDRIVPPHQIHRLTPPPQPPPPDGIWREGLVEVIKARLAHKDGALMQWGGGLIREEGLQLSPSPVRMRSFARTRALFLSASLSCALSRGTHLGPAL